MTQPNQSELKCGHTAPDWNGDGDCITCARDKVLGNQSELMKNLIELSPYSTIPDEYECKELFDYITADRERVALEARIDELRLASDMQYMMRREDRVRYCSRRIAELKAQQERKRREMMNKPYSQPGEKGIDNNQVERIESDE